MSVLRTIPPNITVVSVGYAGARQTHVFMSFLTKMLHLLLHVYSENESFTGNKFLLLNKVREHSFKSLVVFLEAKIKHELVSLPLITLAKDLFLSLTASLNGL